jgi:hypothetical protein
VNLIHFSIQINEMNNSDFFVESSLILRPHTVHHHIPLIHLSLRTALNGVPPPGKGRSDMGQHTFAKKAQVRFKSCF